jgi:hypothetical protein
MNGDGLPDRVFDRNPSSNQEGIYVYLNTGVTVHVNQCGVFTAFLDWIIFPAIA